MSVFHPVTSFPFFANTFLHLLIASFAIFHPGREMPVLRVAGGVRDVLLADQDAEVTNEHHAPETISAPAAAPTWQQLTWFTSASSSSGSAIHQVIMATFGSHLNHPRGRKHFLSWPQLAELCMAIPFSEEKKVTYLALGSCHISHLALNNLSVNIVMCTP